MTRAVFGEVGASLLLAGAALGDFLKCCNFHYKMLVVTWKSKLGCEAGCGLTVSFSDHGWIILGSWWEHSRIVPAL